MTDADCAGPGLAGESGSGTFGTPRSNPPGGRSIDGSLGHRRSPFVFATLLALGLAACDEAPTAPATDSLEDLPHDATLGDAVPLVYLECSANVGGLEVTCATPPEADTNGGPSEALIVGSQGVYVQLNSSNAAYDDGNGRFTFDVTVTNLIEQALGTSDGQALHPNGVRVFFHSGPETTGGTGTPSVTPDGFGTFTASGQAYYQYDEIIEPAGTSSAKQWLMIVPPTVTTFDFAVYVATEVPYPDGYVDVGDSLSLQVSDTMTLAGTIRSAVGNPTGESPSLSYESSDTMIATVDEEGLVTGIGIGAATITATGGGYSGEIDVAVGRYEQIWEGDVSSDWSEPGNWHRGFVPTPTDSARVPVVTGGAVYPVLTAGAEVARLEVESSATVSLGAFDLVVSGDLLTGMTGGITSSTGLLRLTGVDRTLGGLLPSTRVLGTYTLASNVTVAGPLQVWGGRVRTDGYHLRVN